MRSQSDGESCRRLRRRPAQRARVGEHPAVHVEHPDARRRAPEPADQLADLGRRAPARCRSCLARRGAAGRAELADERARLRVVHVDDAERQPRADQRPRQAQLDEAAGRRRAPRSGDPVVRRAAAVVEHEPGRDRPVAARVDREAQELVVGGDDRDLDVVAQRRARAARGRAARRARRPPRRARRRRCRGGRSGSGTRTAARRRCGGAASTVRRRRPAGPSPPCVRRRRSVHRGSGRAGRARGSPAPSRPRPRAARSAGR